MTEPRNPYETPTCSCGHLVVVHQFMPATKAKPTRRGPCTHMDDKGQCQCRGPR